MSKLLVLADKRSRTGMSGHVVAMRQGQDMTNVTGLQMAWPGLHDLVPGLLIGVESLRKGMDAEQIVY